MSVGSIWTESLSVLPHFFCQILRRRAQWRSYVSERGFEIGQGAVANKFCARVIPGKESSTRLAKRLCMAISVWVRLDSLLSSIPSFLLLTSVGLQFGLYGQDGIEGPFRVRLMDCSNMCIHTSCDPEKMFRVEADRNIGEKRQGPSLHAHPPSCEYTRFDDYNGCAGM